ncbi:hypothetical protein [Luteolibacter soli]|uniref:Lipoprotein n=1 Tax=Luteolibacter soli TaxID=3135280 RepID=A0ABU9AXK6_9BACT
MKTILKLACLSLAALAFGNCTYVQPTSGESSSSTTTTTERDGWGNTVTTEESTTYR